MKPWIWYMPRIFRRYKLVKRLFKFICEKTIGHVSNPTEHGYDGGKFCDHWCCYCDSIFQIPRIECPSGKWMEDIFHAEDKEIL